MDRQRANVGMNRPRNTCRSAPSCHNRASMKTWKSSTPEQDPAPSIGRESCSDSKRRRRLVPRLLRLVPWLFRLVSLLFRFDSWLFRLVSWLSRLVSPFFRFDAWLFQLVSCLFRLVYWLFRLVSPLLRFDSWLCARYCISLLGTWKIIYLYLYLR